MMDESSGIDEAAIDEQNKMAKLLLSNKGYNVLKQIVTVVLPAVGALYAGLAGLWGLPFAVEVVGTLALLATFGGVLLGISTRVYNNSESRYDGQLVIDTSDEATDVYRIEVGDLDELSGKNEIVLKVA